MVNVIQAFEERLAGKKGLLEMRLKGVVQFSFEHAWLSPPLLLPLPCVLALLLSH